MIALWEYFGAKLPISQGEYKKLIFPYRLGYIEINEVVNAEFSEHKVNPLFNLYDFKERCVAKIDSPPTLTFLYVIGDKAESILAIEHEVLNEVSRVIRKKMKTDIEAVLSWAEGYSFITEKAVGIGYELLKVFGTRLKAFKGLAGVGLPHEAINYLIAKSIEKKYKESKVKVSIKF